MAIIALLFATAGCIQPGSPAGSSNTGGTIGGTGDAEGTGGNAGRTNGTGSTDGGTSGNIGETGGRTGTGGGTGGTAPQTFNVSISNFAYTPASLSIRKGDTVIWTNNDSVQHTVTSDSGSELGSPMLSKSQIYSHTFNSPGTFDYYCVPHPFMKAKIIVQ